MSNNHSDSPTFRDRVKEKHQQYRTRGLYRYVGINILKIIFVYAILVVLLFLASRYLFDFNKIFEYFIERFSDTFTIILFFISESFLGMVPVDLFVLWAMKFESPLPYLALLGLLSYAGGVISYFIGMWISMIPRVKAYTERRLKNYILFVRKWGGAFIVVAALFPFTPFSMVVIALSLLKYPFRYFLLFALTRLVRFILQGILFFDVLNIDVWIF
jgi:membrane protein YqaA with SNARE-associated domain